MRLRCGKCQAEIVVPPEVLRQEEPRVECPTCHTRFRLKPRSGAPTPPQTADIQLRSTASVPVAERPSPLNSPSSGPAALSEPQAPPAPATTPPRATPSLTLPPADPEGQATVVSTGGLAARGRPGGPVFLSGDLVAGRYRVVRFLAKGGMGEVYEAEDVELRQKVALKTVSANIGEENAAIERFKREIALARLVTHPNVCRIFDLGQHQLPPWPDGTPAAPITFLTMELLHGETLAQRLRREGRMSIEQALPIVEQMAAALDAAHRARIVHRDFKSENVFLERGDGQGARAVVTDFGVARGAEATDHFAAQVTGLGIVGTPAYMAPEQVENKEITPAADIYALGIVLYEMVTGKLPFESPNPLTTAIKRLKEDPAPPHVHTPDLPPAWERTILRCLERKPDDRFAGALEVAQALARPRPAARPTEAEASRSVPRAAVPPAPAPAKPPAVVKPRLGRPARLAFLLVAVIAVSAALFAVNRNRDRAARAEQRMRRSVAVVPLKNLAGQADQAWLATALAEMLSAELGRGDTLRAVPGQLVADARRQLQWAEPAELDREQLTRARTLLGCDFVVAGTFLSLPSALRVDLRLQDAASGALVKSLAEEAPPGELLALVGRLGEGLRGALGADAEDEDPLAGQPRRPEAARLYAEALDALRDARPREAREGLEQAIALEADNPLLHAALSSAWSGLGYEQKSIDAARRAYELARGLPLEDRLAVEARLREVEGRWPEARDLYRKLYEAFPDNVDYGLSLLAAELAAGSPQAALAVADALRQLPQPLAEDPRIDLAEADAAARADDFQRQLAAGERALVKTRTRGATLLGARALLAIAQARRMLGDFPAAAEAAGQALEIEQQHGRSSGQAAATLAVGSLRLDQGDLQGAAAVFQAGAALYREIGDQSGLATALNNLAVARKRQGDLDGAEALYAESEAIYRETGNRRGLLNTLNNRGVLLVDRDRLDEAQKIFESQRQTWQEIGGAVGSAYGLNNLAEIAHLQGRLADSETLHRQALTIRREAGIKPDIAFSLANLAGVLRERGEVHPAAALLEEARALAEAVGDRSLEATVLAQTGELQLLKGQIADARAALDRSLELRRELAESGRLAPTQLAIAQVAFAEGVYDETAQLAEAAQQSFAEDGRSAEEARAASWRLRALAALGRTDEDEGLAAAVALAQTSEQPLVRLYARLAQAEDGGRRGGGRAALAELDAIRQEADKLGLLPLALETQVAWADLAGRAGQQAEADRRRAAAVQRGLAKGIQLPRRSLR